MFFFCVWVCYYEAIQGFFEPPEPIARASLERLADLPLHVSAPASICRFPSSALLSIDDYVLQVSGLVRHDLSASQQCKWTRRFYPCVARQGLYLGHMRSSNQRQISRPSPPSLPLHHSAAVLFLDTAALGSTADILKQALSLQSTLPCSRDEPLTFCTSTIHRPKFGLPWSLMMALGATTQ